MKKKRLIALILSTVLALGSVNIGTVAVWADTSGNPNGVYLKQVQSGTCTLVSAVMMLRQKALNEGNDSWKNITIDSVREYAWIEGVGSRISYEYYGMRVDRIDLSGETQVAEILKLLEQHPEGIEIYDRSLPHAVFLTRYDAENDVFYCADPGLSNQEMKLEDSWLKNIFAGAEQDDILNSIDNVWVIESYTETSVPAMKTAEERECVSDEAEKLPSSEVVSDVQTDEIFQKIRTYTGSEFTDLIASEWYVSYIETVYESGLMSGVGEQMFGPNEEVTLAQAITIASRIYSKFEDDGQEFEHLTGANWIRPYLLYAKNKGLISSELASSDNLDEPVSRAQFAEIISAAVSDSACAKINSISDGQFSDIRESEEYGEAVYRLCRAGIITGDDSGSFLPDASLTRVQLAAIVARVIEQDLRVKK